MNNAPVTELDPRYVGEILIRLPVVSRRAGHNSLRATLGYVADITPEGEFVRDIFRLTTRQMAEKWYGGEDGMRQFSRELAELAAAQIPRAGKTNPA